jgi:hypothetical protein
LSRASSNVERRRRAAARSQHGEIGLGLQDVEPRGGDVALQRRREELCELRRAVSTACRAAATAPGAGPAFSLRKIGVRRDRRRAAQP